MAVWLHSVGYNGGIAPEVLYGRLVGAAPGLVGSEGDARGKITLCLVTAIETVNAQIAVVKGLIADLFATHPDQHIFLSLPRSGTVRAASLLSEIVIAGSDSRPTAPWLVSPERVRRPASRASTSGPSSVGRAIRSCGPLSWTSPTAAAWRTLGRPTFTDVRSTGGCRHPHAIRILARAWLRIIWRCWQDGVAFDPDLHRGRFTVAGLT